ncbi:metal ion binding [Ascochyta rabiei]|uniref:Metal ion binding n=2 Tax=Didymella rabiei TaxID=5454 RepID=A0A163IYH8_DIDRA|nr:metal ion binding [Ascochyta rabiei]
MDDMDSLSETEIGELRAADNQYVLLLIDVHTHMFSEFLMYRGSQMVGRKDMRGRLHDAVKHHTDKLDPSVSATCRVVVRGYYDIEALAEPMRDRVPRFAATLSAMDPYFDFTYVLGEAAVEQKIVDLYSAVTKDENCKHILLAA